MKPTDDPVATESAGTTASDGFQMPSGLAPCDLVMQGGITSGVVYPSAAVELSRKYTFMSVGGASAGAIAAGATAAAEYGRRALTGQADRGFSQLTAAMADLKQPRRLARLFQPTPRMKLVFWLAFLVMYVAGLRSGFLKLVRTISAVLALLLLPFMVVAVWVVALAPVSTGSLITVVLAIAVTLYVLALLTFAYLAWLLPRQYFGMCSGMGTSIFPDRPALTEWLHRWIQKCAGFGEPDGNERVLTFGDLCQAAVFLRLVTTDLSTGRPVILPFDQPQNSIRPFLAAPARTTGYLFDEKEFAALFPAGVVKHLTQDSVAPVVPTRDGRVYRQMPADGLPVIVAARLSLSFPILLQAVPLYTYDAALNTNPQRHLMSDGGITSNFPIHFFDEWLPRWPTFGLSLSDKSGTFKSVKQTVELSRDETTPRWTPTDTLPRFASQMFSAARNWRDTMQSEMPGSRDRVCHVSIYEGEGGLNLNMPKEVIEQLDARGAEAGRRIKRDFSFADHQFVRYLTWMEMMQIGLYTAGESFDKLYPPEPIECGARKFEAPPFAPFKPTLRSGTFDKDVLDGRDVAWRREAAIRTSKLLRATKALGNKADGYQFNEKQNRPRPLPTMRIVPRV